MKSTFPPAIWGWTILILVASFLTWGTIRPTTFSGFPDGFPGGFPGFPGDIFGGISIAINGWNGHLNLGVQLPNWLAVIAALVAAATVHLQSTGAQISTRLAPALLFYSLAHVGILSFILLTSGRGTLGIGAIVMIVALVGLFRAIMQARRPVSHRDEIQN